MAQNKSKKKQAGPAKPRKGAAAQRQMAGGGLDRVAKEYAGLVLDPCGSKLVGSVYTGGTKGILVRHEQLITLGSGGTDRCGMFEFSPGVGKYTGVAAATDVAASVAVESGLSVFTYLSFNASAFRCIAFCLDVMYPGSETGRSGLLSWGRTVDLIKSAQTLNVGNIMASLPNTSRVPGNMQKVIWLPNSADEEFTQLDSSGLVVSNAAEGAGVTVAWTGIPVSTGLTIKITSVVEYLPKYNQGLANTALPLFSKSSLNDVLRIATPLIPQIEMAAAAMGAGPLAGGLSLLAGTAAKYLSSS